MKQILVLDIGTTATKAALMTPKGAILKTAYRDYLSQTPKEGFVEQNAEDWWQAVLNVVREFDLSKVEAIALTGQMQNVILLDEKNKPIRPVILYSDMRATKEAEVIDKKISAETLTELTGNIQTASSVIAKLCWIKENEPESLEDTSQLLLGAADYIAFKLTGNAATDTTTASTTGLMNLAQRTYLDKPLLSSLGLEEAHGLLPSLVDGGTRVGSLHSKWLEEWGIERTDIPVYLGPGDAVATTLGVGSGDLAKPYAYIGTSGWLAYSSQEKADPHKGVFSLAHPNKDKVVCIAPLLTAGANFDWIKEITHQAEHSSMIEAALSKPITKLIYLPYLNGERSPFSDPYARGSFIGLSASHDKNDLTRAVLEGVAFAYRHALEALLQEPATDLVVTGGGARSEAFCQLLADITGLNVKVLESSLESGLVGTLLSTGLGKMDDFPVKMSLTPKMSLKSDYQQKYALYLKAYDALKALFAEQAQATLQ